MDLDEVPVLGRVGVVTDGPAVGQHVLVVRDSRREWWQLYCEPPWENLEAVGISVDFDNYIEGDDAISEVLEILNVRWVPCEEDERIEKDVFDVRGSFISVFWPVYLFDDADYAYRCEALINVDSYLEGYVEDEYKFFDSIGRRIVCDYSPDEKLILSPKEIDTDSFAATAQKFISRYSDPLSREITSNDPGEVSLVLTEVLTEVKKPTRWWRILWRKR